MRRRMKGTGLLLGLMAAAVATLPACTKEHKYSRDDGGTTQEVVATLTTDWTVGYVGRETFDYDDGTTGQQEVFSVTPSSSAVSTKYYFDVLSDADLEYYYGGSLLDFFDDDVRMASEAGNSPVSGTQELVFDRLSSGSYTAYVFGVDDSGSPTGKYSTLDFTLTQETPEEGYSQWIGAWQVSGADLDGNPITYDIYVSQAEANYSYWIDGWETGDGAATNMSEEDIMAWWDGNSGDIVFTPYATDQITYEGYGYVDDGTYDVMLAGNYYYDGIKQEAGWYFYVGDGVMAEAVPTVADSARIEAWDFALEIDGTTFSTAFTSMQYYLVNVDEDGQCYAFNEAVPQFPLEMARGGEATPKDGLTKSADGSRPSVSARSAHRPLSVGARSAAGRRVTVGDGASVCRAAPISADLR